MSEDMLGMSTRSWPPWTAHLPIALAARTAGRAPEFRNLDAPTWT